MKKLWRNSCLALTAVLAFLSFVQSSFADVVAAEQATELLARSASVADKCKFLNPSQRDELAGFVAKAEVAMASKSTIAKTKALLAKGGAEGRAAICNDQEHRNILTVIAAARAVTTSKPAPQPQKPTVPAPAFKKPVAPVAAAKPALVDTTSLENYGKLTSRYYLARRCNTLSSASIGALYQSIVSAHQAVLSKFGRAVVQSVMQQSEAHANASHCS